MKSKTLVLPGLLDRLDIKYLRKNIPNEGAFEVHGQTPEERKDELTGITHEFDL